MIQKCYRIAKTWYYFIIRLNYFATQKKLSTNLKHEYNEDEIQELIAMVNIDNNTKQSSNAVNNGVLRTYNALALIGINIIYLELIFKN